MQKNTKEMNKPESVISINYVIKFYQEPVGLEKGKIQYASLY